MAAPIVGIHTWTEGDTWWRVAERYTGSGLNWVALAYANPHIRNTNKVAPGTRLTIPQDLLE